MWSDLNQWMRNLAVYHRPNFLKYVADIVSPRIMAARLTGKIRGYQRRNEIQDVPDANIQVVDHDTVFSVRQEPLEIEYSVIPDALKSSIGYYEMADSDQPYMPLIDRGEHLLRRLDLIRERRVSTFFRTDSNYDASRITTLANDKRWDTEGEDAINDLLRLLQATSPRANLLVMSEPVWDLLRTRPTIQKGVRSIEALDKAPGLVKKGQLSEILETRVIVASSKIVLSNPGQDATETYIWDKACCAIYCPPEMLMLIDQLMMMMPTSSMGVAQPMGSMMMGSPMAPELMSFSGECFSLQLQRTHPMLTAWDAPGDGPGSGAIGLKSSQAVMPNVIEKSCGATLKNVMA